jgi:hypothetical protein
VKKMLKGKVRGIPLLAILLILGIVSIGVLGAVFSPWIFTNNLIPASSPTPTVGTYTGDTRTFHISAPGTVDDSALITVILTGSAQTNTLITVLTHVEVLNPAFRIESNSHLTVTIKDGSGATVKTITTEFPNAIGKGAAPFAEYSDTFTPTTVGDYTIQPVWNVITWSQP